MGASPKAPQKQTTTNKESDKIMGIKALVGKKVEKEVTFMGEKLKISKLTLEEVEKMQELAKAAESNKDASEGFEVLRMIIRSSADGGSDLSDEDFSGFPIDELSKLSNEIMKFSGIGEAGK